MTVQKMALMPLEVWEEYETIVENMRFILEEESDRIKSEYEYTIKNLLTDIKFLQNEILALRAVNQLLH